MAEFMFEKLVKDKGVADKFEINSFGTSDYEEGNPIHTPALEALRAHGVPVKRHTARQLTLPDVINSDYIIVMDGGNLFDVLRLTGGNFGDKVFKLMYFTGDPRDVEDPWYTRDFERTYRELDEGLNAFWQYLLRERGGEMGEGE